MLNDALLNRGPQYNPFTLRLKSLCEKGPTLVRMRNGMWCEVTYLPANPEDEEDEMFAADSAEFCGRWYIDGSSITADRFDLMEIRD